jgi:hypothetical protein
MMTEKFIGNIPSSAELQTATMALVQVEALGFTWSDGQIDYRSM